MKVYLAVFLVLALIATLLPDVSEAMPKRSRQSRRRPGRVGRARQAPRRGRTGDAAAAEGAADEAAEGAEGGEGGDVPAWCDPTMNLGGFLNFVAIRKWCGDAGYGPDFSPYGAAPAEEEGSGEEAPAEE